MFLGYVCVLKASKPESWSITSKHKAHAFLYRKILFKKIAVYFTRCNLEIPIFCDGTCNHITPSFFTPNHQTSLLYNPVMIVYDNDLHSTSLNLLAVFLITSIIFQLMKVKCLCLWRSECVLIFFFFFLFIYFFGIPPCPHVVKKPRGQACASDYGAGRLKEFFSRQSLHTTYFFVALFF